MKTKKCKISPEYNMDSKLQSKTNKAILTKVQSSPSSLSDADDNMSDFCKHFIILQL